MDLDVMIRQGPKVELHVHLDGSIRPATLIDLAQQTGYVSGLPDTANDVEQYFRQDVSNPSLERYLEGFTHTTAVLQTPDALHRVAYELAQDMAAENIVYAEVRFAPTLHTQKGLSAQGAIDAVTSAFKTAGRELPIEVNTIVCALRHHSDSLSVAELAVSNRDCVIALDLAGPEDGYPPDDHLEAFQLCQRESFPVTIHAGEGHGPRSIWKALAWCGAQRLGHGVRIIDDILEGNLGPIAASVRDRRIPLEVCPSSNVHTGTTPSLSTHPVRTLMELGFRVTISTDNRLMSGTTLTEELLRCCDLYHWDPATMKKLQLNAARSAFSPYPQRVRLAKQIDSWWSQAGAGDLLSP